MILFRASFVVMVSVFLRCSKNVFAAPVLKDDAGNELLKQDSNVQDEVNFMGGEATSRGPVESKTKEAATESSGENPFANFNPNNTIAYSSSNILPNDAPYDMIFIPSSEVVPSDTDDLVLDMSSSSLENNRGFIDTIDGRPNVGEDELLQVSMASDDPSEMEIGVGLDGEIDYGDLLSLVGEYSDWPELSWMSEFSEVVSDGKNFDNTLPEADTKDTIKEPSKYTFVNNFQKEEGDKDNGVHADEVDGYEEVIDGVKTRRKRSNANPQETSVDLSEDEKNEDVLRKDGSSSFSSYSDISVSASETYDQFSSVSEEVSEVGGIFQDVDPKRAEIDQVLARYPRPGDTQLDTWDADWNKIGERREKRGIDLFKYYAVNFPTLEGMRKRGADDFRVPFDIDTVANDIVPSVSKRKRSLQDKRHSNDAWDTVDEADALGSSSSYILGQFDIDEVQSESENSDIYLPEITDDSNELGEFLSHVVSVSPEFESRRGHIFDIPDYNEGKYLAHRSANLKMPSKRKQDIGNVPDPAELLKLYEIVKHLNPQDLIDARKPRMYLPGPHAGYQAYGDEIHRSIFGSKRRASSQEFFNPLPRSLKQVYTPNKPSNAHQNDVFQNTIDEYLESEGSDIDTSSSIVAETNENPDFATTLAELMKEIEELTLIEKLLQLVRHTNDEDGQYRR
ncbi:uncharacterized protein LOC117113519 isoform X2 [Anneissia japonica]|nr:uncharacterized protein LOC117113519 isoform X2 [Anneissia japonica]